MLRIMMASSVALLMAGPALAQADKAATQSPAQASVTTGVNVGVGAGAQTTTPAPQPQTQPHAGHVQAEAGATAQVDQVVSAEFPTYDADKSGDLNEAEFSKWIVALRDKDQSPDKPPMDEAAKAKWAKSVFASADANKDKKIAKTELVTFFAG